MKQFFALLLAAVMLLSFAACGTPVNEPIATEAPEASDSQKKEMAVLETVLIEADALRESILNDNSEVSIAGATYYVSENGNDANDGLTSETAWATTRKVSNANLNPGDGVLFERDGVFRGYGLYCQNGVTYSAYGEGEKPIITGSPENGATADNWTLHGETPDGGKVWKYHRNMRDCGTLVLDGKRGARKIAPYWNGKTFVTKDGEAFNPLTGLTENLSFFSKADSLLLLNKASDEVFAGEWHSISLFEDVYLGNEGALYFRCDEGNPGEVFDSIEFSVSPLGAGHALVNIRSGNVIDNLHILATSDCAFMHLDDNAESSILQNCEISFAGGGVLYYDLNGRAVMAGDGINVIRPCVITNCYFHHIADNGITVEFGDSKNVTVSDITITGNLFEYNYEDIQIVCFDTDMKANNNIFKNILIENNMLLYTCGGWSSYIHSDEETGETYGACIKCGDFGAPLNSENVVVQNNILYAEDARSILYGGNIGNAPPRFTNNRIIIPSATSDEDKGSMIALWANDEHNNEGWDSFYWVWKDEVWPTEFSITSCDDFLNRYLGSGNTVEFIE